MQGLFEGHSYISTVAKVDFLPPRTRAGTLATQCIACVASVSNRVIARKLDRKQKKRLKGEGRGEEEGGGSFISLPLRRHSFFFCSCPSFLDEPREETLPTQAIQAIFTLLKRTIFFSK